MEKITLEKGNPDAWVCRCHNRPDSDGFFPCDQNGVEREPDKGWLGLYVCNRCGVVIDQESLEIVGVSDHGVSPSA